jgi:hypothetical protein
MQWELVKIKNYTVMFNSIWNSWLYHVRENTFCSTDVPTTEAASLDNMKDMGTNLLLKVVCHSLLGY